MKLKKKNFIEITTNLIILGMLILISSLTLNFESQYVFGYKNDEAIYHGNLDSNKISLMVNVYWGSEFIKPMLQIFENYNVTTTFFVGGTWVEKEPELLELIYSKNHEIANHGYFHKNHKTLNYDQNYEEINVTHKIVNKTIGVDMNLFAPPSGYFNSTTLQVANDLGYKTIMWSKDTIDWRDKNQNLIFTRATKNIKGGDLILMHPTEDTVNALPRILEFYKNNNLQACTVTNNLK